MKVTRMIVVFLLCVLTMGVSQCEGIEVTLDPSSTCQESPAEDPVNPYLVEGSPNTCVDFPFRACKADECLGDSDTSTCREHCCSSGTQEAIETCHAIAPFTLEAVEACIRDIEFAACGQACLDSCRSCTDTCAGYYENCTDGVVDRTALGWGWRD